jgi:hypothetical protein
MLRHDDDPEGELDALSPLVAERPPDLRIDRDRHVIHPGLAYDARIWRAAETGRLFVVERRTGR